MAVDLSSGRQLACKVVDLRCRLDSLKENLLAKSKGQEARSKSALSIRAEIHALEATLAREMEILKDLDHVWKVEQLYLNFLLKLSSQTSFDWKRSIILKTPSTYLRSFSVAVICILSVRVTVALTRNR